MDLEDAVPPAEKAAALDAAVTALTSHDWGKKTVVVRLNSVESPWIRREIERLACIARLDAFLIPKAEAVTEITSIGRWITEARGIRQTPVAMELIIETARGLVNVEALAASDPLVTALHLGVGDFAASIGARSAEIGASPSGYKHVGNASDGHPQVPLDLFAYPMMRLLVAARAFGLRAIDGPCGAFRDAIATASTATKAASMGFDGKQVIHPSQIEATRNAFVPSDDELASAARAIAAMEEAERNGQGAVTVDGKMVDYANIRMIRRLMSFKGQS
jgi:malyl-CoA/(S)-citramalyl-CoA lyase